MPLMKKDVPVRKWSPGNVPARIAPGAPDK